jgi:branched-chain amino acid transport system substrate-binding protein
MAGHWKNPSAGVVARRATAVAGAALLATGLAACGGGGAAAQTGKNSTIRIAVLAPLTGAYAADANPKALKLAEKKINADGGVHGRDVKLSIYDTASDAQVALNAANKAVADGVDIAIGGIFTTELKAIEPVFARAHIPQLSLANETGKTSFNVNPPQTAGAEASVAFAQKVLHAKSAALLTTNDEGSLSNAKINADAAHKAGLPVAGRQEVAPTATDITPQIRELKGVDVVLETAVPTVDTIAIRTMRQNAIDVPLVLSLGGIFQITGQLTPPDQLHNVYINSICAAALPIEAQHNELAKAYLEQFAAEYGHQAAQSPLAPRFFDAVHIAAEAVASADSPEKRIKYLESSLDYRGACGSYKSGPGSRYLGSPENAFIMSAKDGKLTRADQP